MIIQEEAKLLKKRLNFWRILLTGLAAIPLLGVVGWDEVALGGPIIFLVETMGFALGLLIFTILWGLLGYAMLLFADFAWPKLEPTLEEIKGVFTKLWSKYSLLVVIPAALGLLSAVTVGLIFYPIYVLIAFAAVIFIGLMEAIRQLADKWVRTIDPRQNHIMRWIGAMVAMIILGPVFAWTLLKWLGFERSTVYLLTLPAGVIFGLIWVPYYSLGVWSVLDRVL